MAVSKYAGALQDKLSKIKLLLNLQTSATEVPHTSDSWMQLKLNIVCLWFYKLEWEILVLPWLLDKELGLHTYDYYNFQA
jgi:hypothetical protein